MKQPTSAIIETKGNIPYSRFGHTVSLVSPTTVVLFGGATGDTGKYSITADIYSFDVPSSFWTKLSPNGLAPTPRAAHCAAVIDTLQMVVYGGAAGGGSLSSDELHLLDLRSPNGQWKVLPVAGTTPGRRYGHSMVFSKPHLLVFGGNTGSEPVNDVWCLDIERTPLAWFKLEIAGSTPLPRVYHSAALCMNGTASGMMVVFGGRGSDQAPLSDTWGLRKHRNGKWDWVMAPEKAGNPVARFQHSTLFMGPLMIVVGGRTNNVNDMVPVDVYDTETSEWSKFPTIKRFRHHCWAQESRVYILGGFAHDKPSVPTNTLECVDIVAFFAANNPVMAKKIEGHFSPLSAAKVSVGAEDSFCAPSPLPKPPKVMNETVIAKKPSTPTLSSKYATKLQNSTAALAELTPNLPRLTHNPAPSGKSFKPQQIPIKIPSLCPTTKLTSIADEFIDYLLRPSEWVTQPDEAGKFPFNREEVALLTQECLKVIKAQPIVLRLKVPIKVFGDIHGQYQDLMRFFHLWGTPADNKPNSDIECYDYLFLGDYVDRGSHSLETICLLMALKVKYPMQIHLLRGNHEDRWINNAFGFGDECAARLGEDVSDSGSIFNRINDVFDWLPLAAIIEGKVLCLHGGIGSQVSRIEQIEEVARPLEVIHEVTNLDQQLIVDILWSDPTDNDMETGIQPNSIRDPNGTGNIVKFGPDKVQEFLEENKLVLILRAHECVMDGFERFAGGSLITVFSATDYCGRHKNAGAMLTIKRNNEIVPNLIYPLPDSDQNWNTDDEPMKGRPPTPPRWVAARENSFT